MLLIINGKVQDIEEYGEEAADQVAYLVARRERKIQEQKNSKRKFKKEENN